MSTIGSQTDVGSSSNEVLLEWIGNGKASNYDLAITNGTLTVLPREVSVCAGSATKRYDGTPLVCGNVTTGGMGFVAGECDVSAVGSQTAVGSSPNEVSLKWIGKGKASNYDLILTPGTLTVLPALIAESGMEPGEGAVSAGGISRFDAEPVTYNGQGHTINIAKLKAVTLVGDTPQFAYSLTSNGVYRAEPYLFTNACVTSVWYKVSAANYEDFVHEARVTILPRELTIRSGSAEKKYDGTPLTCHSFEITEGSFVGTDGVTVEYTGSQTQVGMCENAFAINYNEGTHAANYQFAKQNGTLAVILADALPSPKITTMSFSGAETDVQFANIVEGATVFYSVDGTVPTTNSLMYVGSISVKDTTRIRAIAVKYGYANSAEADETIVCTTGLVGENDESVAARYPNAYGTMTNVIVTGHRKLSADFFTGCSALRHVELPAELESVDADAFDDLPNFEWEIVDGYKYYSNWLFGYTDDAVESLTHTDTLRGVANGALEGCTAIHYFTCQAGSELKHIGRRAFCGCVKLANVLLPEGVTDIGDEAFYGCTKMTNFIIPGTVKTIGNSAFKQCTSLTGALFGYGIESIGDEAFFNDWRISEVDIPSTVTNIGEMAFGGDSSMIRAGLRCDTGKKISDIFSHYANIREITVKDGDGEIPDRCFGGCTNLTAVRYLGDCPKLENDGRNLYAQAGIVPIYDEQTQIWTGTYDYNALVSYVTEGSAGWDGIKGSEALPQAWPLVGGYRRAIATWDQPTYLCQFDSNGGTLGVQDTYQYSEKNVVLPPEPVQSGYQFAGWWTQPVGGLHVTDKTIFIEGVYTYLYAHWIKGHYVFLDPNGGEVVNSFITYVEESTYGVLPMPVRSGYAFGGWWYDGELIEPHTVMNTTVDHTIIAQWTANLYSVRYNPNGGVGEEESQDYVYGVEQALRKNIYTRSGYTFTGWATNETGAVVFRDCEVVSNLTAVADGFVELYAVWEEGAIVDPTNVEFSFGGNEDWQKCYEGVVVTNGGKELKYDTIWKSGSIVHGQSSILKASVNGAGKIAFWWKVSCEKWRTMKLDYLEFAVDGVPCEPWINGETDWTYMEFDVNSEGAHTLTWTYAKDAEGTEGEDCGRVCAVVWTPRLETLAEYLNSTNLVFASSGEAVWSGDLATNHDGVASLKSGKIADGGQSVVETSVEGPGKISFWWKVSSETFRSYQVDYVSFLVDGVEKAWIGGESDWQNVCVQIDRAGSHVLSWIYQKDNEVDTSDGYDCAWLDEVAWESVGASDPIPDLGENPTTEEITNVFVEAKAKDPKLAEKITTEVAYTNFSAWAKKVQPHGGGDAVGAAGVMAAPNAWVSYALGSETLLEAALTDADLTVETFEPKSGEDGKFDFTVSVKDVDVGGAATTEAQREQLKENLKEVFGLEGGTTLEEGGMSSANVDITFGTPENGKVKFTAGPKDTGAKTFFMKVKVMP